MTQESRFVAAYDWLVSACAVIVGLFILLTVVLVTADVVGRYFFDKPIGWVFEVTEHILVCVPFLGMAWLIRRGEHVRIEIVVQLFPAHWQPRFEMVADLLSALACAIATYYAVVTAIDHFSRGIVTYGIYPVPKFILITIIAFGLGLSTIEFLRRSVLLIHPTPEGA
ncbi:MAG: hypothetical protein DHS20C01_05350 [marine bacterium B5-7]|nr:MAG: hypothetical protein DHS20C01_05350 [marine bacterium B5-7]